MNKRAILVSWFLLLLLALPLPAQDFALSGLFSDNMVLQRDIEVPVWGTAKPGSRITVSFEKQTVKGTAGKDGRWMVKLKPLSVGGPHVMTIAGPTKLTLKNILVGDVWLCSGQSNMAMSLKDCKNGKEEIAAANFPDIRMYTVPSRTALRPKTEVTFPWRECNPRTLTTAGGFSGAGYYFGRHLHQELNIPIGLINASWGGTFIEAWMSAEALSALPDFELPLEHFRRSAAAKEGGSYDYNREMAAWYQANDPGSKSGQSWKAPAFDSARWQVMKLPTTWEGKYLPDFDGIVWFRRTVSLGPEWTGRQALLKLGKINDRDTTWINGRKIGALDRYSKPRDYSIPAGILKAGKNCIVVRVLDTAGGGGFQGKPKDMQLVLPEGNSPAVALSGEWAYKASMPLDKAGPLPLKFERNANNLTVLYNGMIAPIIPFAFKGAIWYQGESNAKRPEQYRVLLPALIKDWRSRFGVGEFPFLIVQLANYENRQRRPVEDGWAGLREAQLLTALADNKVGLAVMTDNAEKPWMIHPLNKEQVGYRLGLAAEGIAYGKDLVYSGPIYRSMKAAGSRIILTFDHVGGGLISKDSEQLKGFAIAGADGKFEWADAVIKNSSVIVSSSKVKHPRAVRYGWASYPIGNLYNAEGLPASPFRTDHP